MTREQKSQAIDDLTGQLADNSTIIRSELDGNYSIKMLITSNAFNTGAIL